MKLTPLETELLEALNAIKDLIDRNVIIRDTSKDSDFLYFTNQGIEIINAITLMKMAIEKATE
ncbi:MAG TPA: hypothetical protein ENH82_13515 [bacterium]|nr:hypothetical protein [bacterium]